MLDRENLQYIKNILTLHNNNVDLKFIYDILTAVKENDELNFYKTVLRQSNFDLNLLEVVLKTNKHNSNLQKDIFDSFSENQFASKGALLNAVDSLNILNRESTVFIWGCWYGSILVPRLSQKVKTVIGLDLDPTAIEIGKKFFGNYNNVEFRNINIFEKYLNSYLDAKLIINTSCEHMPPMKEWKWFGPGAIENDMYKGCKGEGFGSPKLSSDCYFAFQSNNMFGIEGHVNCVNSLEEFRDQMPKRADILYEEEVEDTRGTRYMLVGKFISL